MIYSHYPQYLALQGTVVYYTNMPEPKVNIESQSSQMRRGILEFCILLTISKERKYASDIIKELKSADLIVVEGTLYPLLSRLRQSGLLGYAWEESPSGPPRKYYELTDSGRTTLKQLEATWKNLSDSINRLM